MRRRGGVPITCIAPLLVAVALAAGVPPLPATSAAAVIPGGIAFEQPEDFMSDGTPTRSGSTFSVTDVRIVDLNADGLPDVAAAVRTTGVAAPAERNAIAVRRNEGDGTFEAMQVTPTGAGNVEPFALVPADVDGDGDVDLVVSHPAARRLTVHRNRGDGGFDETVEVFTDHRPHDLAVGDVDGDGAADLVVLNPLERVLQVFPGNGEGAFGAPVDHPGTLTNSAAVAVGDVDGDGDLDVVVAGDTTPGLHVWRNDGSGTLAPEAVDAGARLRHLWLGDFDGDGDLDVAMAGWLPACRGCVAILRANGDGTFEPAADLEWAPVDELAPWDEYAAATDPVDADGDGNLDVVLAMGGRVAVAYGGGLGGFAEVVVTVARTGLDVATEGPSDGNEARAAAAADLDADGVAELVTGFVNGGSGPGSAGSGRDGSVTLLRGRPDRSWRGATGVAFSDLAGASWDERDLVLGDWTGDGRTDLITADGSRLVVFPGRGEGSFADQVSLELGRTCGTTSGGVAWKLTTGDVDGDGALDVVCLGRSWVDVVYGNGAGGVAEVVPVAFDDGEGAVDHPVFAHIGDVDGDGAADLVTQVFEGSDARLDVHRAAGARTFAPPATVGTYPRHTARGAAPSALGDLDGDGDLDLLARTPRNDANDGWNDRTFMWLNDGSGGFAAPVVTPTPGFENLPMSAIVLGDLDGDGHADAVAATIAASPPGFQHYDGDVWALLGQGGGRFAPPQRIHGADAGESFGDVELADLDGDGVLDVVANSWRRGVEVLRGRGDGTFDPPRWFSVGDPRAVAVATADLTGDGLPEVVALSSRSPREGQTAFTVHRNISSPTEPPPGGGADLEVSSVTAPTAIGAGDAGAVTFTVTNVGDEVAGGPWVDTVWLSADAVWDLDDRLLGTVVRDAPLAPGLSYDAELPGIFLPLRHGPHHVIVRADGHGHVAEGSEANNHGAAPVTVDVPELLPGATVEVDVADGQERFLRVPAADAAAVLVEADAAVADAVDVTVAGDRVPTATRFDHTLAGGDGTARRIMLPAGDVATWYLRAAGRAPAGGGTTVTFTAAAIEVGVVDVTPREGVDVGSTTVAVTGAGFDATARARLEDGPGGAAVPASVTAVHHPGRLDATFALRGAAVGTYDLVVAQAGDEVRLADAFRVVASDDGSEGELLVHVDVPARLRPGAVATGRAVVQNAGDADAYVLGLRIRADGGDLRMTGRSTFRSESLIVLPDDLAGDRSDLPAGPIPPGATRQVYFQVRPTAGAVTVTAEVFQAPPGVAAFAPPPGLVVEAVGGPAAVEVGGDAAVGYRLRNDGAVPLTGPWLLRVGLIPEPVVGDEGEALVFPTPTELATEAVGEGVTLAPGGSLELTATLPVAPVADGAYRWLVGHVDAPPGWYRDPVDEVLPGPDVDPPDAVSWSPRAVVVTVPAVTVGGSREGVIAPGDRPVLRVDGAPGPIHVDVTVHGEGAVRVDSRVGALPGAHADQFADATEDRPARLRATVGPEPRYLSLRGGGLDEPIGYRIEVTAAAPAVDSVTPAPGGNAGTVTVVLRGAGLDDADGIALVAGGPDRAPTAWGIVSSFEAWATFDLRGVPAGAHAIEVAGIGGGPHRVPFTVQAGGAPALEASIEAAARMRPGVPNPVWVHYANTGTVDLHPPLLTVVARDGGRLAVLAADRLGDADVTLVAPPTVAGAATVPPGGEGRVVLWYRPLAGSDQFTFDLHATAFEDAELADEPLPWDEIDAATRPPDADDGAWAAHLEAERARYGETYGDLARWVAARYARLAATGVGWAIFADGRFVFHPRSVPSPAPLLRSPAAVDDSVHAAPVAGAGRELRAAAEGGGDGVSNVHAVIVANPDGTLPGAARDGAMVQSLFEGTYNVGEAGDGRVQLLGEGTSRADLEAALATAKEQADADDRIVVWVATHGLDDPRDSGGWTSLATRERMTSADWEAVLAGGEAPILFVLDTCHSGAITETIDLPNVVELASADYGQTVEDSKSFSTYLLAEMQQHPGGDVLALAQRAADTKVEHHWGSLGDGRGWVNEPPPKVVDHLRLWRNNTIDRPVHWSPDELTMREASSEHRDRMEGLGHGAFHGGGWSHGGHGEGHGDGFGDEWYEQVAPRYPVLDRNGFGSFTLPQPDSKPPATKKVEEDHKDEPPVDTDTAEVDDGPVDWEPDPDDGEPEEAEPPLRCLPLTEGCEDDDEEVDDDDEPDPPRPPPLFRSRSRSISVARSSDPNEIVGPAGVGDPRWVMPSAPLAYDIHFENLGPGTENPPPGQPLASAPAAVVEITLPLPDEVEPASLELGGIRFGDLVVDVPRGRAAHHARVPLDVEVPGEEGGVDLVPVVVDVSAAVDPDGGVVRWVLQTLDPATGALPADPLVGFLPPEPVDDPGAGQGVVALYGRARSGLAEGATVDAGARIVFDTNDPIDTNTWTNTVDANRPTGTAGPLAPTSPAAIPVSWTGTDLASGVETYDVHVATDGGPFERWLGGTSATTATYPGSPGHRYGFAVLAADQVGHREQGPLAEEVATVVPLAGAGPGPPPPPGSGGRPCPAGASPAPPRDVVPGSAHADAIACLARLGIVLGFGDGTFGPEHRITRGQLATILVRLARAAGASLPAGVPDRFVDDTGSVHEPAANVLAAWDVARGRSPLRFAPGEWVTRAEAATFLFRLGDRLGLRLPTGPGAFADDEGLVHEPAIDALAAAGVVEGRDDGTFGPGEPITRAQAASLVARFLDLLTASAAACPESCPRHPRW